MLSSEAVAGEAATATIDSTGRLQAPPQALTLFPDGRARLVVEADGVRLVPPDPPGGATSA
ncbi:hypothetical protein GCM10025868_11060 [Angustibacter aerolatus]|uniref:Uncharacterized protein n=1 Tax=Angustibacter aerolatus TaxID=1162965 RepID=A0ABQ6JCE2_9ACTN|nr:hypothetical protein GCM10025868_11060 [Angustibacter aerolatus]